MCIKCLRSSKRRGLPRHPTFGQIKALTHRFAKGESIPLFRDSRINFAIEAHLHRIEQAKTKRRYKRCKHANS